MRELIGPLVSVHRLVFFSDYTYCFFDPPVHFVAFSVDHLSLIPIYDMVESDGCFSMNSIILYTFLHFRRVFQPLEFIKGS